MRQILFQIGKNFYGDFSDVATGLWRGLFEPYVMSRVVPAFQMGQISALKCLNWPPYIIIFLFLTYKRLQITCINLLLCVGEY